jgi:hypothetical protein
MYGQIYEQVWAQLQDGIVASLVAWITSLFGAFLPGA